MTSNEVYSELSNMNLNTDFLITCICNYFDNTVLKELLEYIREEY